MSTSVCTNCEDDESKCVRDNCVNCCICARRLRRGVKIMDRRRRVQRALYYRRRAQGAQAERDQALAEVERLRGIVRNWQGDNSGPGGSQEFPDTEVEDLRAEIDALRISARVETGISQEET